MTKLKSFFFAASALTLVIITACSNAAQMPDAGTGGSAALPEAPFVEGGASPVLNTDKLDITVKVTTSDGTPVRIEGCTETELTNDTETFERIALIQSVGFTLKKPALPKAITRTLPLRQT